MAYWRPLRQRFGATVGSCEITADDPLKAGVQENTRGEGTDAYASWPAFYAPTAARRVWLAPQVGEVSERGSVISTRCRRGVVSTGEGLVACEDYRCPAARSGSMES